MVVLVAAIAIANGGWQDDSPGPRRPAVADDKPRTGEGHTRQGAEHAASRYAKQLGGPDMFNEQSRHQLLQEISDPDQRSAIIARFDGAYTRDLNRKIGLDEAGKPPAGQDFVNQTLPASTKLTTYSPARATVEVWCSGLFGLKGKGPKTIPVETNYFTLHLTLVWSDQGWKLSESKQTEGPEPDEADYGQSPAA
ncbi:hypothetical protein ABZT45_34645 [Streptomyces sp. NPDC005356]|uniref:hypothetical protein n=1 Tax=Streptomyces sp. NPDC005356 TaxID=3157167 RepID=UPI0033A52A2C